MNKSPFYELYSELNANFDKTDGNIIPKNFGNTADEIKNVRENVGFIDLSNRGKILFSGKEHLKFLQGMISNDIVGICSGEGIYATFLTVKGKMITDLRLYKSENSVHLDIEPNLNSEIVNTFIKYRLSYKADITDITEQYGLVHICGPNSVKFILERFGVDLSKLKNLQHLISGEYRIIKINRTGEIGFDIIFSNEEAETMWKILNSYNSINPFGSEAMESLRIEAGIPLYGIDMDSSTIPIEAGLWDALDFEKGCYVGQEVIARIKWRGRVNWHLTGFIIEGEQIPAKNDKIMKESKQVGRITSATYSHTLNKVIALGYLRREYKEYKESLTILMYNNKETLVKVTEKKFYNNFN